MNDPAMPMNAIDLSIVVSGCPSGQPLVDCLESLQEAVRGRRSEFVVVVRVGDRTAEIVRARFPDAVVLVIPNHLSAEAVRTRGEAAARGSHVVFVDGVVAEPSDWIDRVDRSRADAGDAAAGNAIGRLPAPTGLAGRLRGLLGSVRGRWAMPGGLRHPAHPSTASMHAKAAAECLAAGDDDGAIIHFRLAIAADPCPPAWVFSNYADALLKQDRFEEADCVYRELVRRHPEDAQGHLGRARVLLSRQDWRRAAEAYEAAAKRFPQAVHACIGLAESLRKMGRFEQADTLLRQSALKWPDTLPPLRGLARVASAQKDFPEACRRWKEAADAFPADLSVRASYIRSLIDVLDLKEARAVFEAVGEACRTPAYQSVLADLHAASYDWPSALSVLRTVVESAPMSVSLRIKEVATLRDLARFTGEPVHRDRAISLCEALVDEFPHSVDARVALAGCYVAASRASDAVRVIDGLPVGLDTHKEAMELKAWRKHHDGDLEGAREVWQAIQHGHYLRAMHGPVGSLEQLDSRSRHIASGDVLLFTVLRNQRWRLPWFFDYYRRLGVTRFFVVDNGSDDGSTEFLLAQDDVHVFRTMESYAKAESGMRWVNELVDRFGDDCWCLYVDVDEMLVFPGMEDLGLQHLLRYMERKGHEAFFAFMLDMHGPSVGYRPECRPGEDLRPLFPYFENSIHRSGAVYCPYRQVSGGIQRLFRSTWDLSKTPIIRGGRSIRFLSSSHAVTPAAVSDVTGVLLHFKMAGAADQWSLSGIGDRNPDCVRRHLSYAHDIQSLDEDVSFISAATERYESSRQLVSLGLAQCPDDFVPRSSHDGGNDDG